MAELEKLQAQLDTWALGSSEPSEEARLDVLEAPLTSRTSGAIVGFFVASLKRQARFDSIEQLVGREQSECAQQLGGTFEG